MLGSKTIFVPKKIPVIYFCFIVKKNLFYTKKQINKIITFNFTRSREKIYYIARYDMQQSYMNCSLLVELSPTTCKRARY